MRVWIEIVREYIGLEKVSTAGICIGLLLKILNLLLCGD